MKEQYLDFDYTEPKEELNKYEEKRRALRKEYDKLIQEEANENNFRKNILEFNSGIYYILFSDRIFDKFPVYDNEDNIIDRKFEPRLFYILYDGNFIVTLNIDNDLYFQIKRLQMCKLPQVDKQLEYYKIELKSENLEHSYGNVTDYPSINQAKINQKLMGLQFNLKIGEFKNGRK